MSTKYRVVLRDKTELDTVSHSRYYMDDKFIYFEMLIVPINEVLYIRLL